MGVERAVNESFLVHISTRYTVKTVSCYRHSSGQFQHIFSVDVHDNISIYI